MEIGGDEFIRPMRCIGLLPGIAVLRQTGPQQAKATKKQRHFVNGAGACPQRANATKKNNGILLTVPVPAPNKITPPKKQRHFVNGAGACPQQANATKKTTAFC